MMCLAVIDTNVLVSAMLSKNNDSATVQVVGKVFSGEITPVFSSEILKEYREVLSRKKFNFAHETVDYFLSAVEHFGILVDPSPTGEILPDMKDLPFYEVVMDKKDNGAYLVTGNLKHFPEKEFIVTARELLDILDKIQLV